MDFTDHKGRPVVVVTGVGVVSSLGKGKDENWTKLTAGTSGIHSIKRFSTEGLRTTLAGTIDFMEMATHSAPALSYALAETAALEALTEAGRDNGTFPGPLFLAAPPVELEWQHKFKLDKEITSSDKEGYERLLEASRAQKH